MSFPEDFPMDSPPDKISDEEIDTAAADSTNFDIYQSGNLSPEDL